jgi:hypothetical protein
MQGEWGGGGTLARSSHPAAASTLISHVWHSTFRVSASQTCSLSVTSTIPPLPLYELITLCCLLFNNSKLSNKLSKYTSCA